MVQVCSAFSAAINGGTYYRPTVIEGTMKDGALVEDGITGERAGVISTSTSEKLRGMASAARKRFYSAADLPGYEIGGKTGTSQTLENGRYVDNQTIATYLGYGGGNTPEYVIMVQVSGKGMNLEGGKHASPIFTDISNWMLGYKNIQPKG